MAEVESKEWVSSTSDFMWPYPRGRAQSYTEPKVKTPSALPFKVGPLHIVNDRVLLGSNTNQIISVCVHFSNLCWFLEVESKPSTSILKCYSYIVH